jgi:hypothetical protein
MWGVPALTGLVIWPDDERLSQQSRRREVNRGLLKGQSTYNPAMLKRLYVDHFRCFVNFAFIAVRKQLPLRPKWKLIPAPIRAMRASDWC